MEFFLRRVFSKYKKSVLVLDCLNVLYGFLFIVLCVKIKSETFYYHVMNHLVS